MHRLTNLIILMMFSTKPIGLDNFKAYVAADYTTFSDMHFLYIDGIAEGSKVATTWILEGIQQQEFRDKPATTKKFETVGVIIFRFESDQIKEGWVIVDALGPARQLGAVKAISSEVENTDMNER